MGDDGKHNPDKGIETDDSIACDMHLDAINALYGQAKEELNQHGTSDTLLSFAADLEDEARQMAEILEKQRGAERKPSYSRDTPGIPYSMLIEYSPKDLCYYVTLPEFIGYTNGQYIDSGKTYVEAAQKGEDVLAFLMETAKEECDELPKPAVVVNDAALPTKDYSVNLEWEGDHYDIWVAPSGRATGGVGYFNVGKTREEALRYADNIMAAKEEQREFNKIQANED